MLKFHESGTGTTVMRHGFFRKMRRLLRLDYPVTGLEFHSTHELVQELISRHNFVGVIVYSRHQEPDAVHRSFQCLTSLSEEQTSTVLSQTIQSLQNDC